MVGWTTTHTQKRVYFGFYTNLWNNLKCLEHGYMIEDFWKSCWGVSTVPHPETVYSFQQHEFSPTDSLTKYTTAHLMNISNPVPEWDVPMSSPAKPLSWNHLHFLSLVTVGPNINRCFVLFCFVLLPLLSLIFLPPHLAKHLRPARFRLQRCTCRCVMLKMTQAPLYLSKKRVFIFKFLFFVML